MANQSKLSVGSIIVVSGKSKIRLEAYTNILDEISQSDFLPKYIPGVEINQSDRGHDEKFPLLRLVESDISNFHFERSNATFNYNKTSTTIRDMITVVDYCLEYIRQANGIYAVHGSACSKDRKSIIFFGPVSGLGKTTATLSLCSNYGFEFIGDEKILINEKAEVVGGVTTIEYNKKILHEIFGSDFHNHDSTSNEIITTSKGPDKVVLMIQPIIVPGAQLLVEEWSAEKSDWHLYEELSRKIRGTSRRVNSLSFGLQSIDDAPITKDRILAVKAISNSVTFKTLRGSIETVTDYIDSLYA